jgi:uncharacterized delta-60 repeat protein
MLWTFARWLNRTIRRKRNKLVRTAQPVSRFQPRCEQLEDRFAPAVLVWDGGGANAFWNNRVNWVGDVAPRAGDTLVFGEATSKVAVNNFAAGTRFAALKFEDDGYTLSGNRIALTGSLSALPNAGSNVVNLPITLVGNRSFAIEGDAHVHVQNIIGGTGGITKTGTGALVFDGVSGRANAYTGATVVNGGTLELNRKLGNAVVGPLIVNTGTALLQANNQIGNAAAVTVNDAGLLDLNDYADTIGKLTLGGGSVDTGLGMLTLGNHLWVTAADGAASISGRLNLGAANRTFTVAAGEELIVSAVIGGSRLLTKAGAGTLDLREANTYTGGTAVTAGTLLVNNISGSATGTGAVSLKGGTLGGNGHIGGRLVLANAPKVSPGMSPGLLSTASISLTWGSDFVVQLYGPVAGMGGYDQLHVTGAVSLGGADLVVQRNFASAQGDTFIIINKESEGPIAGAFAGLAEGATVTAAGAVFRISYQGGDGNDVSLTQINDAAPPPALPGNLDPAFGGDGFVSPPIEVRAADLQADGKLVVAGRFHPFPSAAVFGLARFNADGSLDASFGNNGMVTTDFDPVDRGAGNAFGTNFANAVHVLPDGKILAIGYVYLSSNKVCIARYNTDGSLDTTFGDGGMVLSSLTVNNTVYDALIQPDGKIVVVGGFDHTGPYPGLSGVGRFNADGTPDTTFGTGGLAANDLSPGFETFYAGALQPDGKIVAVGTAGYGKVIVRYNADGTLDRTFNRTGILYESFAAEGQVGFGDFREVAVQADGRIVVSGAFADGYNRVYFDLARYNPNGAPDPTFGGTGKVVLDVPGRDSSGNALTLDPLGKIVAAGVVGGVGSIVTRVEPDGLLETSFGSSGTVVAATNDEVQAVLVDAQGHIIVVSKGNLARYIGTPEPPPHVVPPPPPDNGPPALVLSSAVAAETESPLPVEIRATFSEAVSGFSAADILVGNGTISDFQTINASQYRFNVTPIASGQVTVEVGDSAALDFDGNGSLAADPFSYRYTGTPPTAAIDPVSPSVRTTSVGSITITFSEAVQGLTLADLVLTRNGGNNLLTGSESLATADAISWTLSGLSDLTAVQGTYSLRLVASGSEITDLAGNALSADAGTSWSMDLAVPTVSFGMMSTGDLWTMSISVAVNESVGGFTIDDVTVSSGAHATNFRSYDSSHYSFDLIWTGETTTVSVDIAAGAMHDEAGNGNLAASQLFYLMIFIPW